jgi:hypothetical protein
LHFGHIFLTEGLTFMIDSISLGSF